MTGEIVTAALLNEQVKDNGLLTAPAIMTAQGDLIYGSAANTPARLAKDANSTRSLTNTGTNNNPAWAQVALATGVSGTLPVGNGGTGATSLTANGALIGNGTSAIASVDMSTKGGLLAGDGSGNPSVLAIGGSNDHVLTVDSGETTGMKWAAASGVQNPINANLDISSLKIVGNGGSTGIAISANGEVTMAAQPAVAVSANAQSNVTGDGATHTVLWANEIFDQNSDFASPTFTAPVTGRYLVTVFVGTQGITTASTSRVINLLTSNRNYQRIVNDIPSGVNATSETIGISILADMDAADTFTVSIRASGESSDVVDVAGGERTHLSVVLVV